MKKRVFENQSIKSKLLIIIISTSLIAIIAGVVFLIAFDITTTKDELKKYAIFSAKMAGQITANSLYSGNEKEATTALANFDAIPVVLDACLYNPVSEKVFASYRLNKTDHYTFPGLRNNDATYSDGYLHVFQMIKYHDRYCGAIYLRLTTNPIHKKIIKNLLFGGAVIMILFLAVLLIASRLQKFISAPLLKLANLTGEISENQDFSMKLNYQGNDEIGMLYNQYRKMLNQISLRKKEGDLAEIQLKNLNEQLNIELVERKRVESSLRISEEKYRHLFEHNPASMFIYEHGTLKLLAVNEAFKNQYGYSDEEVTSMYLPDLYPEEEKGSIIEKAKRFKGHKNAGEWHHIKKDGTAISVITTSHDLKYMGKEARVGVVTDITERKQIEEEIRIVNRRLLKAQNIAHLGFLEWDLATNEIFPSEEAYLLYGLPPGSKFETTEFMALVAHPADLEYINENLELAIKEIKPYNIDHRIIRPDGKILWINSQAELEYDQDGKPVKMIGTVMDITERMQATEEIQKLNQTLEDRVVERTVQLVSINKELESFSYSISHDLRAPLRAIYGFSQILASRHRNALNEEGRQYMDYIVEASIRMEKLIEDLLNYSRLGRKSIEKRPIALNDIIDTIYPDFKQKLDEISASFNVDKELPVVLGDESLLQQIFSNLIGNAITYRRKDVPLVFSIHSEPAAKGYLLKVSDNGIGIEPEYWEKIFNIFHRLHSEEEYPGTGIGLATVRKALSILNGTIRVESVVGEGTTFIIHFPAIKNNSI
ncbi:MAG: PAS domain S-box protein [Bacteroidota bacterium]|nr:PAS domain S-box protein [Bacteroidota bacterium]